MSFFNDIKNQFGKTIKYFTSDKAKRKFIKLPSLSSHSILHQSTSPHTPQQYQIAKRKSRHLVGTTCILTFNADVLVHHWSDVILATCFLISRMSSSSLVNQIPHSLFPNESGYSIFPLGSLGVYVLSIMLPQTWIC